MPPDGSHYTESPHPGNPEQSADSRRTGLFDRVRFLESRLDRMEVILLEQDRLIRAQARTLGMLNTPPMAEASRKAMVKIASEVAADNGLTLAELQSRSKAIGICYPRQYAMMLMMDAGYSSPEIGRFFGRDHATVLHGARAARLRGER
jgi:chromosomal replication initiator protein